MVKVKVLQHDLSSHVPLRPGDPTPISRNLNPLAHPFARARERTRALNAAKLERMFSKPFVDSLGGHQEAVEVLARPRGGEVEEGMRALSWVGSGGWDGGVLVHNLTSRKIIFKAPQGHKGKVSGLVFADSNGDRLLSCGVDRTVKMWKVDENFDSVYDYSQNQKGEGSSSSNLVGEAQPISVFPGKTAFNRIDHHRYEPLFATASNTVQIWDETKSAALSTLTFPTSTETITNVKFNLSEASVLASIGSERTFTLYDIRTGKAERRVIMQMASNDLSWSPTLPTTILLASEDQNLYTFDIRNLSTPTQIYKGHVAPVMSCDWAPTGVEFVSGGWDRMVRIWRENTQGVGSGGMGARKDVYHTKRMQRVTSTVYSADARFVISGSDDGNVRIWKAKASEKLGVVTARERAAIEYREALKDKWSVDGEVGRVMRMRHLPKSVRSTGKLKNTMEEAARVKEERRRKHSRAGEEKPKAVRKKVVITEQT